MEAPAANCSLECDPAEDASNKPNIRSARTGVCLCAVAVGVTFAIALSNASRAALRPKGELDGEESTLFCVTIADWGGSDEPPFVTPAQLRVRDQMSKVILASAAQRKLVLALGDNFYHTGVAGVDDQRFTSTFEDVYVRGRPELGGEDMWRVVAGNHDYRGNVSAQIAFSGRSRAWHFPAPYYTFTERVPATAGMAAERRAQFVMIDTELLLAIAAGSKLPAQASSLSTARSAAHWAWLERTLANSTADYLIVAGHHPVWSVCGHGPTPLLVSRLRPLLFAHGVTAYFAGHDHCAEALVDGGVHFHVVGGAHGLRNRAPNRDKVPDRSLAFLLNGSDRPDAETEGAFATAAFSVAAMTVTHHDADGAVLHVQKQLPRSNVDALHARQHTR